VAEWLRPGGERRRGVAEWLRAGGGASEGAGEGAGGGSGAPEIGQIVAGRSRLAMCACAGEGGIGGGQTALIQFGR
jgi:hypothetical protein